MEETERNVLFTNTHGPTEAGFMQVYRIARKGVRIAIFTVAACFFVYAGYHLINWIVWMIRSGEPIFTEPGFLLLLAEIAAMAFIVVWEATAPKRFARRQLSRVAETYNGTDPTMTASFFDDGITFHNEASGSTMQMDYGRFTRILETKDLFLLITQQKQMIDLDKDGFKGMDVSGFRAFMDGKCPNAKRKWKKGDN